MFNQLDDDTENFKNSGLANVKLIASLASSQETTSSKRRPRSPPRPSQQPVVFNDKLGKGDETKKARIGLTLRFPGFIKVENRSYCNRPTSKRLKIFYT